MIILKVGIKIAMEGFSSLSKLIHPIGSRIQVKYYELPFGGIR